MRDSQFVSPDQRFPLADIDSKAEPNWFEEVLGYQEELSLAELLPDYDQTDMWDRLDDLDRKLHFNYVLHKFPSYQRQAYLLHALNDYSLKEVARIQDRDEKKVEDDIQKSTKSVRDYMQESDFIYKKQRRAQYE